jgi:hypothetical protein
MIVAHIAGIPIEETVAMALPALGAAYVAIMATLRARRRDWKDCSRARRRFPACVAGRESLTMLIGAS